MSSHTIYFQTLYHDGIAVRLDTLSSKKAALVLRAVNNRLRQQILRTIDAAGRMTVTELYTKLMLDQSAVSQHLSILRKTGFVKTTRQGKHIYYSLDAKRFAELNKFIETLLK